MMKKTMKWTRRTRKMTEKAKKTTRKTTTTRSRAAQNGQLTMTTTTKRTTSKPRSRKPTTTIDLFLSPPTPPSRAILLNRFPILHLGLVFFSKCLRWRRGWTDFKGEKNNNKKKKISNMVTSK